MFKPNLNSYLPLRKVAIIVAWVAIWQISALLINNPIILASPLEAAGALIYDIPTAPFWMAVGNTFLHITVGSLVAFVCGILFALLAYRWRLVGEFLEPILTFFKSVPVVCVIVLLLIWMGAAWVSSIVIVMVVLPTIYYALAQALVNIDRPRAQMLGVFGVPRRKQLLFFYWPSAISYMSAACKAAVGMSWKSGIAAELIGVPLASIGAQVYMTKITLATADLFAWMFVIVGLSAICEHLVLATLRHSGVWSRKLALRMSSHEHPQGAIPVMSAEALTLAYAPVGAAIPCRPHEDRDAAGGAGAPPLHHIALQVDVGAALPCRPSAVANTPTAAPVIIDFTHTFAPSSITCLLAPSGTGKTTLLRSFAGQLPPLRGTLSGFPEHAGMVFQETRLFEDATAFDNCLLVADTRDAARIEALLAELIDSQAVHTPVRELSGGMKRRVELARALLAQWPLLILDEPFTGLDDASRRKTCAVLLRHQEGRTIIMSTHNHNDVDELGATAIHLS